MKLFSKHLLMFAVLFMGVCSITQARPDNESSPARRINLTVEDNRSVYTTVGERNNYENLLRLTQPDGPYQLTAGMLNNGNNHIVFHRIDDQGTDTEFARLNLNAEVAEPESGFMGLLNFYGDGSYAPSSNVTLTNDDLPDNWGTNGSGLVWQTSGYGTLTFTVPDGYSDATAQLIVNVGTNVRGGYFIYNYNSQGWYVYSTAVSAGGVYTIKTFTGLNSGDVISIYGAESSGSSYSTAQSPDIRLIGLLYIPKSIIPTATVTPTISYKDGENWGSETAIGESVTYSVNDTIDLYGLGAIEDAFYAETDDNTHSDYYNYTTAFNANIILPPGSSTETGFTATADFTVATTTAPTSAAFTGPGYWEFLSTNVYTPSAGTCCYIMFYGSMIYVLPDTYMGNSVNVTVTTSTGDGAGDLYVNGILHTFTAGETYTYTIPVTANGAIEFKSNGSTYSPDFTQIVISGGNPAKYNATNQDGKASNARMLLPTCNGIELPVVETKNESTSILIVK